VRGGCLPACLVYVAAWCIWPVGRSIGWLLGLVGLLGVTGSIGCAVGCLISGLVGQSIFLIGFAWSIG
jgi:hypothetical protein